jgi:hypothetical protein
LSNPRSRTIKKRGITVVCAGTIIMARIARKMARPPGSAKRAMA